jgi:hypothetical protein
MHWIALDTTHVTRSTHRRVPINGKGRVGRAYLRRALQTSDVEVTAVIDVTDVATLAPESWPWSPARATEGPRCRSWRTTRWPCGPRARSPRPRVAVGRRGVAGPHRGCGRHRPLDGVRDPRRDVRGGVSRGAGPGHHSDGTGRGGGSRGTPAACRAEGSADVRPRDGRLLGTGQRLPRLAAPHAAPAGPHGAIDALGPGQAAEGQKR